MACWTFVFWGFCHGIMVALTWACKKWVEKVPAVIGWLATFLFVNVAWVFFRVDNFGQAWTLLHKITEFRFGGADIAFWDKFQVDWMMKFWQEEYELYTNYDYDTLMQSYGYR